MRLLAACLLLAPSVTAQEAPRLAPGASPKSLTEALARTFGARDVEAYLGLWSFADEQAREDERSFLQGAVAAGAGELLIEGATAVGEVVRVVARFIAIQEPRAVIEQHAYVLQARQGRWQIRRRDPVGRIDGLVHLSLDPQGYRADGLAFRFEDFELRMTRGTLFLAPETLGPTVAVFVGEGLVLFQPRSATEREQLRRYRGEPELRQPVKTAFVRIHPADLNEALEPLRLDKDPGAASRWPTAQRYFEEQSPRAFVLDANAPGSPWWVVPGVGNALVSFEEGRSGTLTYAVNADSPEAISLFNRSRRIQVCLYPRAGGSLRYDEDAGRSVDVVHYDLNVRFEPATEQLQGEATLTLRLLAPVQSVRLKLDDELRVDSVSSAEAGRHLFFRVRNQDTLMVSLAGLSGSEVRLKVRYGGRLAATPVENEGLQVVPVDPVFLDEGPPIEKVRLFSNRNAWYPQGPVDDYATARARFDVPAGQSVVSGGMRLSERSEAGRTVVEYEQPQPGKYLSVIVGRLTPIGEKHVGPVTLTATGLGRNKSDAEELLVQAERMLRFFTERFGPCPYARINLVAVEGNTPGGHSPPGMVIVARRPRFVRRPLRDDPANFSEVPGFFLAHELAHQWWGQGVSGQNYRERWLSEGFAQYAAALWTRHAAGEDAFLEVLERLGRWAKRLNDWGPISLGYRLGHVKGNPEPFRALVYNKGAYVLHMLQGLLGDEAFFRGLIDFQERFRYRKAGSDDLREALEAASGLKLEAYFEHWVQGTKLPALRFTHQYGPLAAGFRTDVEVSGRDLPGPLPLELTVFYSGGRVTRRVLLPPEGGSYPIDSPKRPVRVEINADRRLLAEIGGR